jgi:diguanylate cyclase (GGDEF)-like protein/putative nucleotidyltransferase with HDIG domain
MRPLRPGGSRETIWLLPILAPVAFAGAAVAIAAMVVFGRSTADSGELLGLLALLAAAAFVEAFPVPIEAEYQDKSETSLANVFIVGTAVIYDWSAATVLAFTTMLLVESIRRRQTPSRIVYNTALYALAAAAAGGATSMVPFDGLQGLTLEAALGSLAFYVVNIGLLAAVVARSGRERYERVVYGYVRWTVVPFVIMASVTLMLAVIWQRSPFLAAALTGPLIAIALYQRSVHRAVEAMRLAAIDPLTGVGNHGHFQDRLDAVLAEADEAGSAVSLCLMDIDDFKQINDIRGHPVGDRVLMRLASELRQSEEAFRIGGDEFALLMRGTEERDAIAAAEKIVERVSGTELDPGLRTSVSAGVATYPRHASDRGELVQAADTALYEAKGAGKGRARLFHPDTLDIAELQKLAQGPDREARLRAAATLAYAVDARDAYTGSHSHAVGELAAQIATCLGLSSEDIQLVRLAGQLHDLGKLAIPEEILRKPGPLSNSERLVLERHPQIGFRMLQSLGVEPIATWVLHHHERWDGRGYPEGLAAEAIPLGSRVVFVADAYDAMTTERVYGTRLSPTQALAELDQCAGTQFDPTVVAAFLDDEIDRTPIVAVQSA